jgi:hypothetical protein
VSTKVSEAEFAMLEERARASGLTLSEWVRDVLLAGPAEPGAELASEVVLAEVLALRSLFLNLQFRAVQGPMTEAEMRGLIERAYSYGLLRIDVIRPLRRSTGYPAPLYGFDPRASATWRASSTAFPARRSRASGLW